MSTNRFEPLQLEKLRRLGSCDVANAIETFGVRLRNTGFIDSTVRCVFPEFPPMVGYAATIRIRTSEPPMEGERYFYRLDWLDHALSIPHPRVLVAQDMDLHPGLGAFIGDVHANILHALGFIGVVTNGAVRNVDEVKTLGFQMYARGMSVSHSFAHVFDFGTPVEVGHMHVQPGDLIHGDRNGIQTIPLGIADKVPSIAQEMIEEESEILGLCHSAEFSVEKLRAAVAALRAKRKALKR
jgi:regulator of RNase E activity RraA